MELISYTFVNPFPCLTCKLLITVGKVGEWMSFSICRKKFLDNLHRVLLPEIVSKEELGVTSFSLPLLPRVES